MSAYNLHGFPFTKVFAAPVASTVALIMLGLFGARMQKKGVLEVAAMACIVTASAEIVIWMKGGML